MIDFQNLFPDKRESGENSLLQCQAVMLRMLKILDYLCTKHEITYFLTGGTLIGAIRHKGFIPWDDDLDIGMTRNQYEKFIKYAVPELPGDIFFQNPQTDKFYPANSNVDARLRDKYSSYKHLNKPNNKWHEGLQVDIFVYDQSFPPSNFWVILMNKLLKLLNNDQKRANVLKWINKSLPINLSYSSNYMQHFQNRGGGTFIYKKELEKLIRVQFDDMQALIPHGFDSYLKRQYGDYMQLPPLEDRVSGHNVITCAFKPCDHTNILYWNRREDNGLNISK